MWRGACAACIVACGCGRFGFGPDSDANLDGVVDTSPDSFQLPNEIAHYSMDDDPADGVLDDSIAGHAAHCVATVSCPTSVPGHRGNAVAFNGTSQFARVTYGAWLATASAYTYAAWIYLDGSFDQVAFARPYSTGSDDSVGFVAWSNGTGTCMESVGSAVTNESVCGPTLPVGMWFHVAGRWTGTKKALFVNGTKVDELASATSIMDSSDLLIGSDENGGSAAYFWHGKVDELEIFDRALTDVEIQQLAAQ
jgi:hypothetical protein